MREPPIILREGEQTAWDMYYCSLSAMGLHPGNVARGQSLSLSRYAELADRMIEERRQRTCQPSGQQQSAQARDYSAEQ